VSPIDTKPRSLGINGSLDELSVEMAVRHQVLVFLSSGLTVVELLEVTSSIVYATENQV